MKITNKNTVLCAALLLCTLLLPIKIETSAKNSRPSSLGSIPPAPAFPTSLGKDASSTLGTLKSRTHSLSSSSSSLSQSSSNLSLHSSHESLASSPKSSPSSSPASTPVMPRKVAPPTAPKPLKNLKPINEQTKILKQELAKVFPQPIVSELAAHENFGEAMKNWVIENNKSILGPYTRMNETTKLVEVHIGYLSNQGWTPINELSFKDNKWVKKDPSIIKIGNKDSRETQKKIAQEAAQKKQDIDKQQDPSLSTKRKSSSDPKKTKEELTEQQKKEAEQKKVEEQKIAEDFKSKYGDPVLRFLDRINLDNTPDKKNAVEYKIHNSLYNLKISIQKTIEKDELSKEDSDKVLTDIKKNISDGISVIQRLLRQNENPNNAKVDPLLWAYSLNELDFVIKTTNYEDTTYAANKKELRNKLLQVRKVFKDDAIITNKIDIFLKYDQSGALNKFKDVGALAYEKAKSNPVYAIIFVIVLGIILGSLFGSDTVSA